MLHTLALYLTVFVHEDYSPVLILWDLWNALGVCKTASAERLLIRF